MKKSLIMIISGVLLEILAACLFILGLSVPTLTGPSFMHAVWVVITAVGAFLIGLGIALAIMKK